jgi:glycogen synthase
MDGRQMYRGSESAMKVFMLGWEFPPYISGGVGAACQGLTQALLDEGTDVLFMLPRPVTAKSRPKMKIVRQVLPAVAPPPMMMNGSVARTTISSNGHSGAGKSERGAEAMVPQGTQFPFVPATAGPQERRVVMHPADALLSPYLTAAQYRAILEERKEMAELGVTPPPDPGMAHAALPVGGEGMQGARLAGAKPLLGGAPVREHEQDAHGTELHGQEAHAPIPPITIVEEVSVDGVEVYAPSLLEETHRYARIALAVAGKESFDVVHAHDWMTFEAARAVADAAGVPLVLQIHSTEYDRAPYEPDPMVVATERAGMASADSVIAVSKRVKQQLVERYGVPAEKIDVVYNAVDGKDETLPGNGQVTFQPRGKLVLFLGRITAQKGPEHFLAAASKVLEVYKDVKFVMAGEGDRRVAMEELAEELGIGERVMFTGFLSRPEVETLFQTADVYVMPSVSEPFGLVSLEALRSDVPVIISKQSGVAELLHHVLKVDFWDTDDLANKILAVLRHPPLADTLREEGQHEVRQLTWHDAARQTVEIYERLAGMRAEADAAVAPAGA